MNKVNTKTGFCHIVIAIALASTSFSAHANRPAMQDEVANMAHQAAQEKAQIQQRNAEAERAAHQAVQQTTQNPSSSVDRIMQQQATGNVQHQTTGDVLVLPAKEMQTGETINIKKLSVPRRGVKMDAVRRDLGPPIATSPSVGQPPITRWTYPDRVVYFEYSTVLHVVAR